MPQNAGKHISERFKFQIFAGEARPRNPRGMCCSPTRRACYASTIHFSLLLIPDQTPITFSIDNPATNYAFTPYHFQEVTKLAAQVRQLYGSNMKSVSPVHLHLTGLVTGSTVYLECVRQSLDFSKLMVSEPGPHTAHVNLCPSPRKYKIEPIDQFLQISV